jgi:hypothetical protein
MSNNDYQLGQDIANLKFEVALLRSQLDQLLGGQPQAENTETSKND